MSVVLEKNPSTKKYGNLRFRQVKLKKKANYVLFLDFDGVLHPDAVYLSRQGPMLRADGELFMWAPYLVEILEHFPSVSVVLSTSWVRHLGFNRVLGFLPAFLVERVVGATWHSSMGKVWADEAVWDGRTRYDQISRYAARAHLSQWISLDDESAGWAEDALDRLVACNSQLGLGDPDARRNLYQRLEQLANSRLL